MLREGKSLAETPTWSVATVTSIMIFVCFLVERCIYWFGKWLKKTRRKALYASLEKIKEELMLLGLISLLLGQFARWISEICVDSSLFNSRFYACSEEDYTSHEKFFIRESFPSSNETDIPPKGLFNSVSHRCPEGREPFVSYEGLEQLHRFLFVLGITHVLYCCVAVGLAMIKIYSWRKWEAQAILQAKRNKVMRRQTTFAFHHASHPWSRNRVLIWMLCFLRQFKSSIRKSDYMALRLGFITNHRLPQLYDFHKYMVRSMEDEFHTIVGIRSCVTDPNNPSSMRVNIRSRSMHGEGKSIKSNQGQQQGILHALSTPINKMTKAIKYQGSKGRQLVSLCFINVFLNLALSITCILKVILTILV